MAVMLVIFMVVPYPSPFSWWFLIPPPFEGGSLSLPLDAQGGIEGGLDVDVGVFDGKNDQSMRGVKYTLHDQD